MPRPCKKRRICAKPSCIRFGPQGSGPDAGTVTMTLEEYESIRLMDYEGLTQEQAARQMDAARTTVQGIYSSARRKIAQCLVNGHMLHLEGGNFVLCEETGKCCHRHCCNKKEKKREGMDMRIGVTYENGQIYQHFGHTEQFKVYDVQDNKVVSSTVIDTNGSGHGALAGFLLDNKVDTLICGGIGGGAQNALNGRASVCSAVCPGMRMQRWRLCSRMSWSTPQRPTAAITNTARGMTAAAMDAENTAVTKNAIKKIQVNNGPDLFYPTWR